MAMVEVAFTPLPAHVRTARLVAVAVARRSGVADSLLDEVRLAVGEACSRAVEAHRQHCPAEPVKIELTDSGGRFEVVVTGSAPGGPDPGAAAAPSAASAPSAAAAGPADVAPAAGAPAESAPAGSGPGLAAAAPGGVAGVGGALDAGDAREAETPGDGHDGGLNDGLGLAVIAELADDVKISRTPGGISVCMSWPSSEGPA